MQRQVAKEAIEILSQFPEAEKLLLFGSVNQGKYRPTADVDIAFICDNGYKWFLIDENNEPQGLKQRVDSVLQPLTERTGIKTHVCIYWADEYDKGIELYSGKKLPPDFLHEVGTVVYEREGAVY